MDENKHLLIVKGQDKTNEIASYEVQESLYRITYHNSSKVYPYQQQDVTFLKDPVIKEITESMAVYKDNIFLYNVCRIMDFGTKIRVKCNNGESYIFDKESIRIDNDFNSSEMPKSYQILNYWRKISPHVLSGDEDPGQESFLKKQYDRLFIVAPESVLNTYLNGAPVSRNPPLVSDTIFPFRFNLSQKEALKNALESQLSIIEGPPGTGKTQTILNIIANLVGMQNMKIAVVSGNNAAVQNVRDKLESERYHFLVASLGSNDNKKEFFANLPQRDVSEWMSDTEVSELVLKIQRLNSRIHNLMELENERAMLQQKLSAYRLEKEHFEVYYDKQDVEQIKKLSFYRQTPDNILSFLVDNRIVEGRGRIGGFIHNLKLVFKHGYFDFKKLKDQEIDVLLNYQRKYYELKINQLTQRIEELARELDQGSFQPLLQEHKQYSEQLFRHKLHVKYHELEPIKANAMSYKNNFDDFIDQYPIVLSTTHSLRNCIPDGFLFDYVIIDESSQVDLLTGALALSCCKHAIIVGDTKQLPQIVNLKIKEKLGTVDREVEKAYDYFNHNLLSSLLALYGDEIPKVMLKEHYRCHPQIIEFCNQKYYDGKLIAFTTEKEEDRPLLIYRTAAGNHMREVTHGRKGKFNQRELDVITQEVLVDLDSAVSKYSDIGFATPYRKQVDKAISQLYEEIESDTIHKYQGREKPIMIFSTVLDSTRAGKIGMKFVNDPCKINVAVSRAQHQFILVTDNALFRKFNSEVGDLIRYMEYSTLDDNIVESEIVSVFDLLYKEYSEKLREFKGRLFQRSKYESENIMTTLLYEILQEEQYKSLEFVTQMYLKNLLNGTDKLDEKEKRYVQNRASVDFVIYHKLDKYPMLVIEVDGFKFHEDSPQQTARDQLKDGILGKYGFPPLRLPTTGSGELDKIRKRLDEVLRK
ncbi:AAA domain-containing protein [Cohnella sp.]|uniref:AAA domain-containing protein n=1 Tax=Cohnella sp. TaxID=1883426 RepID=UPI003566325E